MNIFKLAIGKAKKGIKGKCDHYYVRTGKTKIAKYMAATEYQEKCAICGKKIWMFKEW